jgi:hypothetical protein
MFKYVSSCPSDYPLAIQDEWNFFTIVCDEKDPKRTISDVIPNTIPVELLGMA